MTKKWLAESFEDGRLAARVVRDGDRLVASWPRLARLSVEPDGSDLVFERHPEAAPAEVEKLRSGGVRLPQAHLAGSIPVHASAVAIEGGSSSNSAEASYFGLDAVRAEIWRRFEAGDDLGTAVDHLVARYEVGRGDALRDIWTSSKSSGITPLSRCPELTSPRLRYAVLGGTRKA